MDNYKQPPPPDNNPAPPPPGTFPAGHPPYYAPPPPEEMATGKVVGLSTLACCIPLVGPLISLIFGIKERFKKNAMVVIVISAVMLFLSIPILAMYAAVLLPIYIASAPESVQRDFEQAMSESYINVKDKAREAEIKANVHSIQLSLEMFFVDHEGTYPDSIEQLIELGYIDVLPSNPFTESPMLVVEQSDPPETRQGNFSYLTITTLGKNTGYTLFGYGSVNTTDSVIDGESRAAAIVLCLTGGE